MTGFRRFLGAAAASLTLVLPGLLVLPTGALAQPRPPPMQIPGGAINDMLNHTIVIEKWMESMQGHMTADPQVWEDVEGINRTLSPEERRQYIIELANREGGAGAASREMTDAEWQEYMRLRGERLTRQGAPQGSRLVDDPSAGTPNFGDATNAEIGRLLALTEVAAAMVRQSQAAHQQSQILNGGTFTVASLEPIYAGYDPYGAGAAWMSIAFPPGPSSAPTGMVIPWYSMSAAGNSAPIDWVSPSSAGNSPPLDWYLPSIGGPLVSGSATGLNGPAGRFGGGTALEYAQAWNLASLYDISPDLARQLYGPLWSDGAGVRDPARQLLSNGAQFVATTSGISATDYLRLSSTGDLAGLNRLLAQPFNILVTWGTGMYDLDLHMTGPDGVGGRFHIYFSDKGSLSTAPYAALIQDCVCTSGSEVILTSALLQGGVYRISAFNYGNQSAGATEFGTANVVLQVVRGGEAQGVGSGTTIVGGRVLFTISPTAGQAGNTWNAVEIDPETGRIFAVNHVSQSSGSSSVP